MNTNGMMHPMTALRDFSHALTAKTVAKGEVFDAISRANVDALKASGDAAVGDLTEHNDMSTMSITGRDTSGPARVDPVDLSGANALESDEDRTARGLQEAADRIAREGGHPVPPVVADSNVLQASNTPGVETNTAQGNTVAQSDPSPEAQSTGLPTAETPQQAQVQAETGGPVVDVSGTGDVAKDVKDTQTVGAGDVGNVADVLGDKPAEDDADTSTTTTTRANRRRNSAT